MSQVQEAYCVNADSRLEMHDKSSAAPLCPTRYAQQVAFTAREAQKCMIESGVTVDKGFRRATQQHFYRSCSFLSTQWSRFAVLDPCRHLTQRLNAPCREAGVQFLDIGLVCNRSQRGGMTTTFDKVTSATVLKHAEEFSMHVPGVFCLALAVSGTQVTTPQAVIRLSPCTDASVLFSDVASIMPSTHTLTSTAADRAGQIPKMGLGCKEAYSSERLDSFLGKHSMISRFLHSSSRQRCLLLPTKLAFINASADEVTQAPNTPLRAKTLRPVPPKRMQVT